jgi:hypothetical protein
MLCLEGNPLRPVMNKTGRSKIHSPPLFRMLYIEIPLVRRMS